VTINLTTIGSRKVEIHVGPAALPEACGGCTLWVTHWRATPLEERTAYALTPGEAKELAADIIAGDHPGAVGGVIANGWERLPSYFPRNNRERCERPFPSGVTVRIPC
jgi:hypothetical protein